MVKVLPPKPRSTITEAFGSLRIVIPVRGNWFLIALMSLVLPVWSVGIGAAFADSLRANNPNATPLPLLVVLSVVMILVLGGTAYWLAWNIAGQVVLIINQQELTLRRELFGLVRSQEFDRKLVRELRQSVPPFYPWDFSSVYYFAGVHGGPLVFDYGARTYRFGTGLDEAEAKVLLAAIGQRFPDMVAAVPGEAPRM
jgi:hypothetical protein